VVDPRCSRQGGGGYVLFDGPGKAHSNVSAAGTFCNSYRAELVALRICLRDMLRPKKRY
jgi:hypothetical protein